MSASAPSWRLASRGLYSNASSLPIRTHTHQTRSFIISPRRAADDDKPPAPSTRPNPVLEKFLRENPTIPSSAPKQPRPEDIAGDLSASSIFEDDRRAQVQAATSTKVASDDDAEPNKLTRDPRTTLSITDPNPNARERFERKKVIQMVRKGGRLTKEEFVKRTEREHLTKSHNLKTSVKKLGALARQIQGKRIEDAISQMRFSKKKVAAEVLKQLEFARDEAVVMRGMGLGGLDGEAGSESPVEVSGTMDLVAQTKRKEKAVEVQLKDGKRHLVEDRSEIYIDQAWVGRGPYGTLPDYRARGRVFIMRTPWTSISLLLKEESTRVREFEEREAKRRRQKLDNVWVHLPDRPIQTKQQWYSW